ncbi:MAG TPA: GAF domain-containing protein [Chryseosolibacter sp.]
MKSFFKNNWIVLVIGIAFTTSAVLAVRNNYVIRENQTALAQADLVKRTTQAILTTIMHGLDLGVRGYGLTKDDKLLIPYREAIQLTPQVFHRIDSLLTLQRYPQRDQALSVMAEIDAYTKLSDKMIELARTDQMEEFTRLLLEDKGYAVWKKYSDFATPLFAYEDALASQSLANYQFAIQSNLFLQFAILILALPMLFMFVSKVNAERKKRYNTLLEVDRTDRTYVFDNGAHTNLNEDINARAVVHVKEASSFIASLAEGSYGVQWNGLNDSNRKLNERTLAGNLSRLRDRLHQIKVEDEQRNWANEGLAKFTELVRKHQDDSNELAIKAISFLTRYIDAQQGSLFVVEREGDETFLQLRGCYAFDKRKFVEKRIELGTGLVGQVFLEGQPILLKQVPQGYTHITSGLGGNTPECVSIIPLKHDQTVVAVIEFASFKEIARHQVSYLERAGEFLAAAIMSTRTAVEMKRLLDEARIREEMMKQREEELQQNMEELQATQEQLQRNTREHFNLARTSGF